MPRAQHVATLLGTGEVLVAAGTLNGRTTELYDPATGIWTLTGNSNVVFIAPTLTTLRSGKAMAAAGYGGNPIYHGSTVYDPATGLWAASALVRGTHGAEATATLLRAGKVLLVGGYDAEHFTSTAEADLYQSRN